MSEKNIMRMWRRGRTIGWPVFAMVVGQFTGCGGGGGGGASTTFAALPSIPAPTPPAPTPTPTPTCSVAIPECLITSNPISSQSSPIQSGTQVSLIAACNAPLDSAIWRVNAKDLATGLSATDTPTTSPNILSTYTYRFEYSNCAGNGATEVETSVSNVVLTVSALTKESLTPIVYGSENFKLVASWDSNIPSTTQLKILNAFTGAIFISPLDSTLSLHHVVTMDGLISGTGYRVNGISTVSGAPAQQTEVVFVAPQ